MKIFNGTEYMPVNKEGMIARQGSKEFSGEWRLLGAVRFNNFGLEVERVGFSEKLTKLDWYHKNGSQKWHIKDLDHGTVRVWMNPRHRVIGS